MSYVTRSGRRTNKVNYSDTQRSRTSSRSVTPQQVIPENTNQDDTANETEENEIEMNDTNNNNDIIQEPPQKRQKISKTTSSTTANKPSPTNRRRRRRRPLRNKNKTKTSSSPLSTTTNTNNKPENEENEIKDEEEDENDSSEQDEDGDQVMDLTSFDSNRNNKNKNKNRKKKENENKVKRKNKNKVPPSIQIPDLPTLEELEAMEISISPKENKKPTRKQRRARPKKKIKSTRKKTTKTSSKQELSSSDEDESSSSSDSDDDSDDLEILSPRKKRILPSLTPKKKTQKTRKKSTPKSKQKKEVRRARKRICSQQARDRIARARHQRLFMINAKIIDDFEREYAVLGSTGNVYTITISTLHNCTCPDFAKGNLCKHVMFVLLKVLRVPSNSEYVYQKALLTTELDEIFAAAPQTLFGTVMANANVRRKYKSTMGDDDDDDAGDIAVGNVERKPLEGDCPVCMEEIDDKEATTWCRGQCGNNVHVQCFKEWKKNALRDGTDVVCMFCRCEWIDGPEDGVKGGKKRKKASGSGYNEGYLNLASEQGMSRVRDTSSYYQSGWRGYGRWYGGYRRSWY